MCFSILYLALLQHVANVADVAASLENPAVYVKLLFENIRNGQWLAAGAIVLVVVMAAMHRWGKRLHDALPDDHPLDRVLFFLFDTKPGGWLRNYLTVTAGGLGTALLAAEPITVDLVKSIVNVALAGAGLWELVSDLFAWWQARKMPAVAPAANEVPKP